MELLWMNWSMAVFTSEARSNFREVIPGLKDQGCDAFVLGCTEIPLLVT